MVAPTLSRPFLPIDTNALELEIWLQFRKVFHVVVITCLYSSPSFSFFSNPTVCSRTWLSIVVFHHSRRSFACPPFFYFHYIYIPLYIIFPYLHGLPLFFISSSVVVELVQRSLLSYSFSMTIPSQSEGILNFTISSSRNISLISLFVLILQHSPAYITHVRR